MSLETISYFTSGKLLRDLFPSGDHAKYTQPEGTHPRLLGGLQGFHISVYCLYFLCFVCIITDVESLIIDVISIIRVFLIIVFSFFFTVIVIFSSIHISIIVMVIMVIVTDREREREKTETPINEHYSNYIKSTFPSLPSSILLFLPNHR